MRPDGTVFIVTTEAGTIVTINGSLQNLYERLTTAYGDVELPDRTRAYPKLQAEMILPVELDGVKHLLSRRKLQIIDKG